jgi:hypothetical protein
MERMPLRYPFHSRRHPFHPLTRPQPDQLLYTARRAHWPAVERWFGALTGDAYRQAVLLRHDLATQFGEAGDFATTLTRPGDPPLLDLHFWLLHDWAAPTGPLAEKILVAQVLDFCAQYAAADRRPGADTALIEAACRTAANEIWQELLHSPNGRRAGGEGDILHALLRSAHAAATAVGGLPSAAPPLFTALAATLRLWRDLTHMRADLVSQRENVVITRVHRKMDIAPDEPISVERALGALVLTGVARESVAEARASLTECEVQARALALPTLAAYVRALAADFGMFASLLSFKQADGSRPLRLPRFFSEPDLASALAQAEQFLLADESLRESWEVQRRGMLGAAELVGKVFAPGLVLEILGQCRTDLGGHVSRFFDELSANDFRYFPHPAVPPDADDLGLALRLLRYSPQPEIHRQLLSRPLAWLRANVAEDGRLPCWFTREVEPLANERETILWGGRCLTVEANLLRGLGEHGLADDRDLMARAADGWLSRWLVEGLGGNSLYTEAYALHAAAEWLTQLAEYSPALVAPARVAEARRQLARRLGAEAAQARTPQEIALCLLVCLREPLAQALLDENWVALLLNTQRYDGGWAAEPLYVTPGPGERAMWYASRLVTTALCYHALHAWSVRSRP